MRVGLLWSLMVVAAVIPAFGSVTAPNLGSAISFGLLGGTISNTGDSVVTGDVGATTTITGFPPGTATGTVFPYPTDPTVVAAYNDFVNAFNLADNLSATQTQTDLTQSREFYSDNVYRFTNESPAGDIVSTAGITLTFSGPDVFIIVVDRDLTVNGDITFDLINGAQASNIYWIVGRTTTFDPTSNPLTWYGDVLAGTSFTMSANTGGSGVLAGTVNGCVFVETANTLAGESMINGCGSPATGVPEPATSALLGPGCLLGLFAFRKLRSTLRK